MSVCVFQAADHQQPHHSWLWSQTLADKSPLITLHTENTLTQLTTLSLNSHSNTINSRTVDTL